MSVKTCKERTIASQHTTAAIVVVTIVFVLDVSLATLVRFV